MPGKPKHPCNKQGCNELTTERYCTAHQAEARQYDRYRGTAASRGYDSKWQKYRLSFLKKHPLCAECEKEDRLTPATVVDHIKPHKGDKQLFWDKTNHQSLCKPHHDAKTAREDMGSWTSRTSRGQA